MKKRLSTKQKTIILLVFIICIFFASTFVYKFTADKFKLNNEHIGYYNNYTWDMSTEEVMNRLVDTNAELINDSIVVMNENITYFNGIKANLIYKFDENKLNEISILIKENDLDGTFEKVKQKFNLLYGEEEKTDTSNGRGLSYSYEWKSEKSDISILVVEESSTYNTNKGVTIYYRRKE